MDRIDTKPDDARRLIRERVLGAAAGWNRGAVLTGVESLPGAELIRLASAWQCGVALRIVTNDAIQIARNDITGIPLNILRIPGGCVATDAALAVTADGRGAHVEADGTYDAERFLRRALHRKDGRTEDPGDVFVLTTQYYNNYSHWNTQVCASAKLMLRFCSEAKIADPVFVVPFGTSSTGWKTSASSSRSVSSRRPR